MSNNAMRKVVADAIRETRVKKRALAAHALKWRHTGPTSKERKRSNAEIADYLARNPVRRW